MDSEFDRQVAEGNSWPFTGWDFSPIASRWRTRNPPWDYARILREKLRKATSMVDLGTGGGEFLASLGALPATCFATEGYRPNFVVAERRLGPIGVRVLPIGPDLHIGLPDQSIDLVACRHEDFSAAEVYRILRPGGSFVTQQVGTHNNIEFQKKFGAPTVRPTNNVASAVDFAHEISAAGLVVDLREEARYSNEFLDLAAVVFYLRAIPWEVPGFSVDRDRKALYEIYKEIRREGVFQVTAHRLLVVASRQGR
jgi:SAM-dependent methyltransferase